MSQRQSERLSHHLRGRRGAEKLAAAARRGTRPASQIGRFLERDGAVHEPDADCLNLAGVFTFFGQQRHATWHEHHWKIVGRREGHHHGRQPLVAGGHAKHAAPGRKRSDEAAKHRGGVVAERQTVEHRCRALRSPIAWIGAGSRKRNRPGALEDRRRGLEQQAHLPMSGVISERDGRSVGRADATVRREHQELVAAERGGFQPMPAFCVHPNRSPEGRSRSISAVKGRTPAGPRARVEISNSEESSESNGLDDIESLFSQFPRRRATARRASDSSGRSGSAFCQTSRKRWYSTSAAFGSPD